MSPPGTRRRGGRGRSRTGASARRRPTSTFHADAAPRPCLSLGEIVLRFRSRITGIRITSELSPARRWHVHELRGRETRFG